MNCFVMGKAIKQNCFAILLDSLSEIGSKEK